MILRHKQIHCFPFHFWFKHIYFITSIHSTYTQYITGGLGWKQKLIRTLPKHLNFTILQVGCN